MTWEVWTQQRTGCESTSTHYSREAATKTYDRVTLLEQFEAVTLYQIYPNGDRAVLRSFKRV